MWTLFPKSTYKCIISYEQLETFLNDNVNCRYQYRSQLRRLHLQYVDNMKTFVNKHNNRILKKKEENYSSINYVQLQRQRSLPLERINLLSGIKAEVTTDEILLRYDHELAWITLQQ